LNPTSLLKYLFEREHQVRQRFINVTAIVFSLFILSFFISPIPVAAWVQRLQLDP
jgi:hypothetical protein